MLAAHRAHDALCDRQAHAEGVSNGQHRIAHPHFRRLAKANHGQAVESDAQHRQVGLWVGAHHTGLGAPAIGQGHLNLFSRLDHMVVGEHIALGADDHPGAQAHLLLTLPPGLTELVPKEPSEQRVIEEGVRGLGLALGGEDVDHGRHGPGRRLTQAAGRRCGLALKHAGGLGGVATQAHLLVRHPKAREAGQPMGLERAEDEQGRQGQGGGLCKEQPETFDHVKRHYGWNLGAWLG